MPNRRWKGSPLPQPQRFRQYVDQASVAAAAAIIASAKRPLILAGNGVIREQAWDETRELVERANVPFVNTFMAKGILPFAHPLNLFTVGGRPYPKGMRPLHEADLIVAVGFDLVEYDPEVWNEDQSRRVIHIHSLAVETDRHFPVKLELVGDIKTTLKMLTAVVQTHAESPEHMRIRERRQVELRSIPTPSETMPRNVMWTLSADLPENAIVLSDVGLHKVWVSRWYRPKAPNRTIIFNGLALMGGSLPGGIAAKLVEPKTAVVVVSGDGGFLMNAQELETATRLGLTLTVIVFNDRRFSLIEKKQREANLAVTQISFTNPDFDLFARSFGADYRRVADSEEFPESGGA